MPNTEMQKANRVEWLSELRAREQAKEAENDRKIGEQLPDGRLNPLMVLKSLDNVLSDATILVADGGDFVGSAAYIVRSRGPLQWYFWMNLINLSIFQFQVGSRFFWNIGRRCRFCPRRQSCLSGQKCGHHLRRWCIWVGILIEFKIDF